jgi:hypothetical protein
MYQDSVSAEPGMESGEAVEASAADASIETGQTAGSESAEPRETAYPFRDELARAMHAAAEHERLRIEASVDEDATVHVEKVRGRALAEAAELKRLAEDDVAGIRGWAKSEIERIRAESDVQIDERRERLEQHLVSHATIIDGEVDRVSEAVEGYRHELEAFFVRLSEERDPTEIARLADTVPEPPDFEVIRAVARAEAVDRLSRLESEEPSPAEASSEAPVAEESSAPTDERELVAVMDPALADTSSEQAAAPAETSDDTPATEETEPAAEAAVDDASADMATTPGETTEGEADADAPEPVAAAAGPSGDTNPATRFIRSLTSWGSADQGNGDQTK